ncbi:MAG: class I SAM-dependent rRNA methyltransferase [Gammaproteobacteria bacterium]
MTLPTILLKKDQDRRIRTGHPWIFSNEINLALTPIKGLTAGDLVTVLSPEKKVMGVAYVNPHSLISARIFSRNPNEELNLDFFKKQVEQAFVMRERLFDKPYYRLIFGEADGLPGLIVDRFNEHLVVQINTAGMDIRKDLIKEALCAVMPDIQTILLRNDSPVREYEGLTLETVAWLGETPKEVILTENDTQFIAPLWEGQKTGWFYDHRMNRLRLKEYAPDKKVLDVFSYLGGWGIQAAHFGAKEVDCIESSATASDFIKRNAELNQVADKVNVITDDAFDAMKKLQKAEKRYDIIILDPPAFVKRTKDRKEGLLAYQRINESAIRLLAPGGILITCSCSMHATHEDFMQMFQRLAYRTQTQLQLIERGHQGPDHPLHISIPETDYLKAYFIRKL